MTKLGEVRKAVTAEVAALVVWSGTAWVPDGTISRAEWYLLALALLAGLGVYAVPNAPNAGQQLAADAKDAGYVYDDTSAAPGPTDSTPGSSIGLQPAQGPAPTVSPPVYDKPSVDGS